MSSANVDDASTCFFCDSTSIHKHMPYIIARDMRGVMLSVCENCFNEHEETERNECEEDCKCMILAGVLIINPRVKHADECDACTYTAYGEIEERMEKLKGLTEFFAVYYNHLGRVYEVSDYDYSVGPDGIIQRLIKADDTNLEELKEILNSSVAVGFNDDGIMIDGLNVLDWSVKTKKYKLIQALGELKLGLINDDTAFAMAIENEDVEALRLLVKYNMNYYSGAEGFVIDESVDNDKISAYHVGMRSSNPVIRSLVLLASINPDMRRVMNLNTDELIELVRKPL